MARDYIHRKTIVDAVGVTPSQWLPPAVSTADISISSVVVIHPLDLYKKRMKNLKAFEGHRASPIYYKPYL